jgi:hypothetical protein
VIILSLPGALFAIAFSVGDSHSTEWLILPFEDVVARGVAWCTSFRLGNHTETISLLVYTFAVKQKR